MVTLSVTFALLPVTPAFRSGSDLGFLSEYISASKDTGSDLEAKAKSTAAPEARAG